MAETLANVADLVAKRLDADVCSIYLTDADLDTLNLSATIGLDPDSVGRVRLSIGEGLVGAVAELGAPIAAGQARDHPRFKYIPETGEERYTSLLAAPLLVQGSTVGVLAIQNVVRRDFDEADVNLLQTCAQLLAPVVMNAQLLALMSDSPERRAELVATLAASGAAGVGEGSPRVEANVELQGIATSRGVAIGPVYRIDDPVDLERVEYTPQKSVEEEGADLTAALAESRREIEENREKVGERFGPEFAAIFHTQIQILEDKGFVQNLEQSVVREGNAVVALRSVLDSYRKTFEQIEDEYFRERGVDIIDVGQRIMENLLGVRSQYSPMEPGAVVIVDQVLAGLFARLEVDHVAAIVSEHGGSTSHGAIFARTLEIPAVTGVTGIMAEARNGESCIVDGTTGRIYLAPDETLHRYYEQAQHNYEVAVEHLDAMRGQPSETRDGCRVRLSANVGLLNDLRHAEQHGAEGIGLFRTELLALVHRGYPSEEEQVQLYGRVVEQMSPRPVTIRTLDLGGDKGIANVGIHGEDNPQLGLRSIRLSLENRRAFRTQLRAILKTSHGRDVKLLLPMISSVEELREARALIEETRTQLDREGVAYNRSLPVGAMIEVPAAAIAAPSLAAECEFLSIGTNDLTQYTLAVDRGNERVAHLYDSLHPAVLALIDRSIKAADRASIPISICGEMASNPLAVPILVGLGIGELSVVPAAVPVVKEIVRALDSREVADDARQALRCASPRDVHRIATERLRGAGLLEHMDIGGWLKEIVEDQPSL
ncbi:MAG: phosphoenolpyruvate--protein phosphotransferase [bacterium TMED88]|nr:phosphoenolpyruvate--protein phosphotransferase [Deltaproteobacteria bacterium]OUV29846.1 MAG: phosphoenolpyruvate--protein phosphotransferase [bacterium TMED88]